MNKRSIQSFAGGIIFATTIMAGYHYFFDTRTMNVEDAKIIIEEHGMTITTKDINEESKKTSEEKKAPSNKETLNKQEKPLESSKEVEKEEQSTTFEKEEEKASSFMLTIKPGMNPDSIATILEKQGIINEKNAFTEYIEKNNLSTKVQLGEYVLTKNMSIQQIAKTITK
jgi:YceG-like family